MTVYGPPPQLAHRTQMREQAANKTLPQILAWDGGRQKDW